MPIRIVDVKEPLTPWNIPHPLPPPKKPPLSGGFVFPFTAPETLSDLTLQIPPTNSHKGGFSIQQTTPTSHAKRQAKTNHAQRQVAHHHAISETHPSRKTQAPGPKSCAQYSRPTSAFLWVQHP